MTTYFTNILHGSYGLKKGDYIVRVNNVCPCPVMAIVEPGPSVFFEYSIPEGTVHPGNGTTPLAVLEGVYNDELSKDVTYLCEKKAFNKEYWEYYAKYAERAAIPLTLQIWESLDIEPYALELKDFQSKTLVKKLKALGFTEIVHPPVPNLKDIIANFNSVPSCSGAELIYAELGMNVWKKHPNVFHYLQYKSQQNLLETLNEQEVGLPDFRKFVELYPDVDYQNFVSKTSRLSVNFLKALKDKIDIDRAWAANQYGHHKTFFEGGGTLHRTASYIFHNAFHHGKYHFAKALLEDGACTELTEKHMSRDLIEDVIRKALAQQETTNDSSYI